MVAMQEVREAVDHAKEILEECGIDIDVTADQLWSWFETDLPFPDIELGEVIVDPLTVIHELVEIDEVLKMGLSITKDVIIKHPAQVDDAHWTAARVELKVAEMIGAFDHIEERIGSMEKWCVDHSLPEKRRAEYRQLLAEARSMLGERIRRRPCIPR
ncbi:MAG: hypothetical protein LUO79_05540 [Methanomassiliicoccales archaeon]|nr:hypothetical protein [Methanomassiliicoccales archaeon]